MTPKTVTVVARIKARAGREGRVQQMLAAMVEPTSAEKGCISYDLHSSPEDKALFLFYENWRSRADLEKHLRMPYLQAFLAQSEELLAEPIDISLWELVS